jgi:hypothetical protein
MPGYNLRLVDGGFGRVKDGFWVVICEFRVSRTDKLRCGSGWPIK